MTFRQLILSYLNSDTPEGDFARDFKADYKKFKKYNKAVNYKNLRNHLDYNRNTCREAKEVLEILIKEHKKIKKN
jgi:hypothetical protein